MENGMAYVWILTLLQKQCPPEDLKNKICDMIESYIETVIDTDDTDSISDLLSRKAPVKDWIVYYLLQIASGLKDLPGKILFQPTIPFRLVSHF